MGAFYGTHNEGNIFPDLDSVGTLFPNFLFFENGGKGALPKIFKLGNNHLKKINYI